MILYRQFILRDDRNAKALWTFLKNNWREMAKQEKPLVITCEEFKAKRTNEQNRRMWAILDEIAINAWVNGKRYTSESWAEFFKRKFIGHEETPDGESVGISTTSLNTAEFAEYSDKIEAYAVNELGIEFTTIRS